MAVAQNSTANGTWPKTNDNSNTTAGAPSTPGKSHTAVIVGVVVGVVGGLTLLALILWLCHRRRKQTAHDSPRSRSPVRRVIQEEDAGEVLEYLPPQYRDDWDRGGMTPSGSTPSADSYDLSLNSSASGRLPIAPGIYSEHDEHVSPLKRAYMRTFGQSRSQHLRQTGTLQEEYKRMVDRQEQHNHVPTRRGDSKHQ